MKFHYILFGILFLASQSFAFSSTFGTAGSNGSSGSDGRAGQDGRSITVFAQKISSPISYTLRGNNGGNGEDGRDGNDAWACMMHPGDDDLTGADAGKGGDGGDGGAGGNGGNTTIYYSDLAQLKNILIDATPGYGGRGADPGRGGDKGCRCDRSSWRTHTCIGSNCHDEEHSCTDGKSGDSGRSGNNGHDGNYGHLILVKSDQTLPEENSIATVNINKLEPQKAVSAELTENLYLSKTGASQLLAAGSHVANRYYEFSRRSDEVAHVIWASQKDPSKYTGSVKGTSKNGTIQFTYDSADVFVGQQTTEGHEHTLTITDAFKLTDFANITLSNTHTGKATQIIAATSTPRPQLVKDYFYVKITQIRWLVSDKVVFDGQIPATLVQSTNDKVIVNLGKLQFKDSDSIWSKKLKIEVQMSRRIQNADQFINKTLTYTQAAQ